MSSKNISAVYLRSTIIYGYTFLCILKTVDLVHTNFSDLVITCSINSKMFDTF